MSVSFIGKVLMRILVVYGGRSAERDISLLSAEFVIGVLKSSGHSIIPVEISADGEWLSGSSEVLLNTSYSPWQIDIVGDTISFDLLFPVLHGPYGEDGTIQGLCEIAGWACAGPGVLTSAAAMNKKTMKILADAADIRQVSWKSLRLSDYEQNAWNPNPLEYPLFIKPARMGSSIGISKVENESELDSALKLAFQYDDLIVIEEGIDDVREIEVSLLSDDSGIVSSVPGEILSGKEWYSHLAKYSCSDSKLLIPAPLTEALSDEIKKIAERAFALIDGRGFARADFLLDGETVYFNEINTIPGFTGISMFPKLWEESGIPPRECLERIIEEAVLRHSKIISSDNRNA